MLLLCTSKLFAIDQPNLRIAVPHFAPPYVMQGFNRKLSGFDIVMLTHMCTFMDRKCIFVPMSTDSLLQAVADKRVDLAVGALTITLERYKMVNFSIPYLLSNVSFLGKNTKNKNLLSSYSKQKIGVTSGSGFANDLIQMPSMPKKIVSFKHSSEMIEALNTGKIDLALMDSATTTYWQNHSSSKFTAIGKPFLLGFGLGIAVNMDSVDLVKSINQAILNYESTPEFRQLNLIYFDNN